MFLRTRNELYTMWLAVATLAVASVTVGSGLDIPPGLSSCVNSSEALNTTMVIDCAGVQGVQSRLLEEDLDTLLSDVELKQSLRSLYIRNTPLERVPTSVCRLGNLVRLNLDRNRLARLPDNCFGRMPGLRNLSACFNNITALQNGLFDGLRNLKSIRLWCNQISAIGPEVFTERANLFRLTSVDLSHNRLTTLGPWPATLGMGRSPDRPLNVSVMYNRIANLSNDVGWRYNCSMGPSFGRMDFTRNRLTHLSDMLDGWGLNDEEFGCLSGYLAINPSLQFRLGHNPFVCDCRDFRFYELARRRPHFNMFYRVYCSDPIDLYRSPIVRIPLIQFVCALDDGCPEGCECSYRPYNSTVHVNCRSNNFTSLPQRLPPLPPKGHARYKLDFSDNRQLRRLERRSYLEVTSIFDVGRCSVAEIDPDAWQALVHVDQVFLNDNSLTKLPREYSLANITSIQISLVGNPWDCSCERSWMHDWFNATASRLSHPSSIFCESPPRLRGVSILWMYKDQFCVDRVQVAVTTSLLAAFGCIGLLIMLGVSVYCLRVWLHRRWNFHPFDRDECVGEHMDYDVFLSCSPEDHDTHGRRLVDLIQSKGYRVFRPGAYVTDDMMTAVQRSRRTVCLLSKHFVQSQYCLHEFKSASEHNATRHKRLVMLTMFDNPLQLYANDCAEAAALRRYLRLRYRRCIDTKDKRWLDKLFYALPVRPLPAANDPQDELMIEPGNDESTDTDGDVQLLST